MLLFSSILSFGGSTPKVQADSLYVDRLADVVFAIDGTGSMGDEINSVKENLAYFVSSLNAEGVDVRIRFIIYRDTECGEDTEASDWFGKDQVSEAIDYLNSITASGGGDTPESLLDAYGKMFAENGFRDKAAKFCVALTDADYKTANTYGEDEDSILLKMKEKSINSSIVAKTAYFTELSKFVSAPSSADKDDGGMKADIDGDYKILLKDLVIKIVTVIDDSNAIKIQSTMIVLKKRPNAEYSINGGTPQTSCVFKGLKPDTEYTFTVNEPDVPEKTFTVTTEPVTGAQIGKIPSCVYEGEVYQVRPNADIQLMMDTPDATIHWSSTSDCLIVTDNRVGNGCEMIVNDCKYNANKLLKVMLTADIEYSIRQSNGTYKKASKRVSQSFNIKNTIDAMDIQTFHGTTDNIYQDGNICLTTKDYVWMDVMFNQGDAADVASVQKLTYFISDKYGNKNSKGTAIAKVTKTGLLSGVAPGLTYLTIAAEDSYNKYSKTYKYAATIPVVCPPIISVEFDIDSLKADKKITATNEEVLGGSTQTVCSIAKGSSLNLGDYVKYNPTNAFNQASMKCSWTTSNRSVATITKGGVVKFLKPGYVIINMTPTGGYEIDAATGKRTTEAIPYSIIFKVKS